MICYFSVVIPQNTLHSFDQDVLTFSCILLISVDIVIQVHKFICRKTNKNLTSPSIEKLLGIEIG